MLRAIGKIISICCIIIHSAGCSVVTTNKGYWANEPNDIGDFSFNGTSMTLETEEAHFHIGLLWWMREHRSFGPPLIPIIPVPSIEAGSESNHWREVEPTVDVNRNTSEVILNFEYSEIRIPNVETALKVVNVETCLEAKVENFSVVIPPDTGSGCLVSFYFSQPRDFVDEFALDLGTLSFGERIVDIPTIPFIYHSNTQYKPLADPHLL